MKKEIIPIFFSCDDNYIPFLCVTMKSIIDNSNEQKNYEMYVLHTTISKSNQRLVKQYEKENIKIEFVNLENKVKSISKELDNVRDYYTQAIFYRLFIASLFPQFHKAIYLDCDIVVLNDIAKFYEINLEGNILGAIVDDVVANNEDFKIYTKETIGVESQKYFNSGVLIIDLDKYREHKIEEKFVQITKEYNFPSIAPDQDFLNFACFDNVKYLDKSWNRMPIKDGYQGELNLIHYNMFMKPWHYDIIYENYFWDYAKKTEFYSLLKEMKLNYSEECRKSDLEGVARMVKTAYEIIDSKYFLATKVKR